MKLTYLGHASISVNIGNKNIVFDPFITENELAKNIDVDSLKADYILLTHGHADHVADVERIVKNTRATIVSNFEIVNWFAPKGVVGHPMNHGGKWKFDFCTVKYVNAIHSSSMPDGSYGGNPGGFVVWDENKCIYVAGDTALTEDMKTIPKTCPKLDLCVLPIGDNFTMDYKDAIIASDYLECDTVLAYHYDTFGYIVVDKEEVKNAFKEAGKKVIFLDIGETMDI